MQGARGADAEDVQGPVHGLDLPGGEIDVGQGVQFGHDDIDVVGADAVGQYGDTLAVAFARHGYEFTGGVAEFQLVQQVRDHVHAARVAYKDHIVSQFLRLKVDMERGAVSVDDEFRCRNAHDCSIMR